MLWAAVFGIALAGGVIAPLHPPLLPAPQGTAIHSSRPRTIGMGDQRQVEGTIKSVDVSSDSIILEDGDTLVVPSWLDIDRSHLKPGASLRAQYEERGGRKIATTIAVRP